MQMQRTHAIGTKLEGGIFHRVERRFHVESFDLLGRREGQVPRHHGERPLRGDVQDQQVSVALVEHEVHREYGDQAPAIHDVLDILGCVKREKQS